MYNGSSNSWAGYFATESSGIYGTGGTTGGNNGGNGTGYGAGGGGSNYGSGYTGGSGSGGLIIVEEFGAY